MGYYYYYYYSLFTAQSLYKIGLVFTYFFPQKSQQQKRISSHYIRAADLLWFTGITVPNHSDDHFSYLFI